jgi:hypothetical protein
VDDKSRVQEKDNMMQLKLKDEEISKLKREIEEISNKDRAKIEKLEA